MRLEEMVVEKEVPVEVYGDHQYEVVKYHAACSCEYDPGCYTDEPCPNLCYSGGFR